MTSAAPDGWRVRKGTAIRKFSDRLVVQGGRRGMLDLSVCLLADGRADGLGFLRPLAAACASEGIRRDTGIVSWLHWPDLVTIDGLVVAKTSLSLAAPKKPSGEKTQATIEISVNCFAGTSGASTSILEALGVEIEVDLLRDKILHALNWYHAEWEMGMRRKLVERMRPTIAWLGRDVEVTMSDGRTVRGRAKGLDDDLCSLLLEQQHDGRTREGPKTRRLPPQSVEHVRVISR
jgi:biotin-(acetyl-CoA carboxylase) ligase